MALSENKVTVQNFTGGLITDYHELNTPQNISVDEANCELNRKGFRQRRLGMVYETGYVQNSNTFTTTQMSTNYIDSYDWKQVNNNSNLNFLVVQTGNILSFYDKSYSPVSSGQLAFTINLDTYAAPGVTSTADTGISVASGNGILFVTGAKIAPFYVQYSDSGSITITPITIQIRDLAEQDNSNAPEARLSVITNKRLYDLYNQGWNTNNVRLYYYNKGPTVEAGATTVLSYYLRVEKVYPPKTGPWWIGKRIGDKGIEVFDPYQFDSVMTGNTLSALGHYIVNAFSIDRSTASGIPGLAVETTSSRPTAVAYFAGKVFYALGNTIYYSQTITNLNDLSGVGKCYQEADPTSEQINDLIATDGGTITIPASATPLAFFTLENCLVLFTTNGLFLISGASTNSGFSATDYSINKISDVSCVSARTIIDADGIPIWWAPQGIFTLEPISTKQSFSVKSLSMKRVQNLYDAILPLCKQNAKGAYDHIRKRAYWTYGNASTASSTTNRFYYNNVLILDMLFEAFLYYSVSDLAVSQPSKVCGVFNVQPVQFSSATTNVVDSTGANVLDQYGNVVTVNVNSYTNNATVQSDVMFLVVGPVPPVIDQNGAAPLAISFGGFTGATLYDWTDTCGGVVGANYTSYLNTFYNIAGYMTPHFTPNYDAMLWMYSPYVYVYLENSTNVVSAGTTGCGDLTVTSPSIMAYNPSGTVGAPDTYAALPDYTNGFVYLMRSGTTGSTNGIMQFNALTTGAQTLARTVDSIGGVSYTNNVAGGAWALLSNGHMTFVGGSNTNSAIIGDLYASGLTYSSQFGISSGSLAQSTGSRILLPLCMQPLRFGTTEGTVITTELGAEIDFIPEGGSNQYVRTIDEGIGVVVQGIICQSYGTAYVLGKPTASGLAGHPSTPLGLYKVLYAASGVTSSKIGTVSPSQVDATWSHWSNVQGIAYDSTDGNVIMMVTTADAVANQNYVVKLSVSNAAVLWKCAVNNIDSVGDSSMPRHRIHNQTLFHMGASKTLYIINTATGVATTQTLDNLVVNGGQISDDCTNSFLFYGNWTQGATVPTYLGDYMGTGGNHSFTNKWARFFVGTVAGQTRQPTTAAVANDVANTTSCLLQVAWDWASAVGSHKWTPQAETYKYRNNFAVAVTKNKVRGKGRTMQLKFSSTPGKDFQLLGWGIWYTKNQHP